MKHAVEELYGWRPTGQMFNELSQAPEAAFTILKQFGNDVFRSSPHYQNEISRHYIPRTTVGYGAFANYYALRICLSDPWHPGECNVRT